MGTLKSHQMSKVRNRLYTVADQIFGCGWKTEQQILKSDKMNKEEKSKWVHGYICAVCNLIRENGADHMAGSILTAGIGRLSIEALKDLGIDRNDLQVLEDNRKSLFP